MKKIIIYLLIFSITFTNISLNFHEVYGQDIILKYNKLEPSNKEKNFLTQLEGISNQLDILSANTLDKIAKNESKDVLLKDTAFIKSQIRNLRLDLSEYHKTESGNIEKNPISLVFLNTLNFYSISLSYLIGAIESSNYSDESKSLQYYYTNKSFGDFMLLWVGNQVNKK